MKNIIDKLIGWDFVWAGASLIYGLSGEIGTYIAANELINHAYNMSPIGLKLFAVAGILNLAVAAGLGKDTYNHIKAREDKLK